jgi:arsenite methyltransferase
MNNNPIIENVKKGYAGILKRRSKKPFYKSMVPCCKDAPQANEIGKKIGYTDEQLFNAPEGANLGIGCGNPTAFASIKPGDTVLDLGSGAGFDCFLAAQSTGPQGQVIGVDITPEMVNQAKENAIKGNYPNVEFRIGAIENLPIENESIDLIISNCVINLSDQKEKVFQEAFRVTKPNGKIIISDIVLLSDLPDYVLKSLDGHVACLSGAISKKHYTDAIKKAGFIDIHITKEAPFPIELMLHDPIAKKIISENHLSENDIKRVTNSISSITVSAQKPI